LVIAGWATTVTPIDARPESVSKVSELGEDRLPLLGQVSKFVVETAEFCEELFALDMETEAYGTVET
jgi:hypothetical protein